MKVQLTLLLPILTSYLVLEEQSIMVNFFFTDNTVIMGRCCNTIPLQCARSRELRGSILYTDCQCLRRNGLQLDCRRTGCQNAPPCECIPAPLCEPARVAGMKHCCNPHAEPLCIIAQMRHWNHQHCCIRKGYVTDSHVGFEITFGWS